MTAPRRIRARRNLARRPLLVVRVPGTGLTAETAERMRRIFAQNGARAIIHDDRVEVTTP